MNTAEEFFASCPTGLEKVLEGELRSLGVKGIHGARGGLRFTGTFDLCYRINLESRVASRLLWRVHQGEYRTEGDVREAASALPWHDWFDGRSTIKVSVSARSCPLKSLEYV
ncbi:MAG: THUMP domain-containing protein, partial [Nitrospirales bacterium]